MSEVDQVILILQHLKGNWSLTGELTGSSIAYSTRWYDTNIAMPQVCITPNPGGSYKIEETGLAPTLLHSDTLRINIWVRPDQDSNKSIGEAKNNTYLMRREVERLISGSRLATGSFEQFVHLGPRWRTLDEMNRRPVIFRTEIDATVDYFRDS